MYGIYHIRSVSVGLDSQTWYLFIYITGYLNVRKISEMMDFRTLVGPLVIDWRVVFSDQHNRVLFSKNRVLNFLQKSFQNRLCF